MSKKASESPMTFFSFQDIMACVTGIMILVCLILALDPLSNTPSASTRRAASEDPSDRLAQVQRRVGEATHAISEATAAIEEAKSRPQVTSDQLARLDALIARDREGLVAIERRRAEAEGEAIRRENQVIIINKESQRAADKAHAIRRDLADKVMKSRVRYQSGVAETMLPLILEATPSGVIFGELDVAGTPVKRGSVAATEPLDAVLAAHPPSQWYGLLVVRSDAVAPANTLRDTLRGRGYEVGWQLWDASEGGFFDAPAVDPGAAP